MHGGTALMLGLTLFGSNGVRLDYAGDALALCSSIFDEDCEDTWLAGKCCARCAQNGLARDPAPSFHDMLHDAKERTRGWAGALLSGSFSLLEKTDIPGNDVGSHRQKAHSDAGLCAALCRNDARCAAFTMPGCQLKGNTSTTKPSPGYNAFVLRNRDIPPSGAPGARRNRRRTATAPAREAMPPRTEGFDRFDPREGASGRWLDEYAAWHTAQRARRDVPCGEKHAVVFAPNDAGLGDRLRAMTAAFGFAINRGMLFFLSWHSPRHWSFGLGTPGLLGPPPPPPFHCFEGVPTANAEGLDRVGWHLWAPSDRQGPSAFAVGMLRDRSMLFFLSSRLPRHWSFGLGMPGFDWAYIVMGIHSHGLYSYG